MDRKRKRMKGARLSVLLLAVAAGTGGCATVEATETDFSGEWSVDWCDEHPSGGECGGFHVRLVQTGDRLCGSYTGATPGLRQIDEGGARAILGGSVGNTGIVAIRSARSGAIYLARLHLSGGQLAWDEFETVQSAQGDVAVTGGTAMLKRDSGGSSTAYRDTVAGCTPNDQVK